MVKNNGCGFGRETRQMVKGIKEDVNEIKIDIKLLANHYSKRIPLWTTLFITILSSLVVGLIVRGLHV